MIAGELGVFLNAREGNPLEVACALILLDHRAVFLLKPAPGGEGLLPPVGSSGQRAGDLERMTEEAVAENERAATEVLADPLDAGLKLGTLHIGAAQTYTEHAALASLGEALLEPLWGHPRDAGVVAVQADANDLRYLWRRLAEGCQPAQGSACLFVDAEQLLESELCGIRRRLWAHDRCLLFWSDNRPSLG